MDGFQTFFCLISDVGLNLLSHILPLKLRTTFISYISFGESSSAPPCTTNRRAFFENVSPTTSRSFEIVITEAGPHGFTFGFLPKRPRTIRVGHLFYILDSPCLILQCET
ncbi:hypothetical protein IGI04_007049 [Brassica rapa subsp. trilocularis]|uniref:FAD-binding FR-type domain-containing protein n=1 Tax=Brassica rapa subsp. trilocularis TaxID=1813537 RepID=A0ABQ7NIQ5_BRACM|nr:hypothetical protein IGI04_007049 [Brassica rapa subsp. trilocularis]